MKIFINGEIKELAKEMSLDQLLKNLALPSDRIAVELNKEVVRKKDWESITLNNDDKIEVIHFVGGG